MLGRVFKGLPRDIPIAWEYSAYLMGAAFMLGSGLTLRAGMHVRVELLLKGGKARLARQYELALVGDRGDRVHAARLDVHRLRDPLVPVEPAVAGQLHAAVDPAGAARARRHRAGRARCSRGCSPASPAAPTENEAFRVATSTTE